MKKLTFFLAFALIGVMSFGQVVRTRAIVAKPDTCMNGVDYTNNIYLTLDDYRMNTRTGETTVQVSMYTSARARNLYQTPVNSFPVGFPLIIWNKADQETALIAKLAQIFNVPIANVTLQN